MSATPSPPPFVLPNGEIFVMTIESYFQAMQIPVAWPLPDRAAEMINEGLCRDGYLIRWFQHYNIIGTFRATYPNMPGEIPQRAGVQTWRALYGIARVLNADPHKIGLVLRSMWGVFREIVLFVRSHELNMIESAEQKDTRQRGIMMTEVMMVFLRGACDARLSMENRLQMMEKRANSNQIEGGASRVVNRNLILESQMRQQEILGDTSQDGNKRLMSQATEESDNEEDLDDEEEDSDDEWTPFS